MNQGDGTNDHRGPAIPRFAASGLFREEAVRHHFRAREFGDVLRLPPRWTRVAYPLILLVLLVGSAWLAFGEVARYARGSAVLTRDPAGKFRLEALLPAEAAGELRIGAQLRADWSSGRGAALPLTVDFIDDRVMDPCEAARLLDFASAGLPAPAGPVVRVGAAVSDSTLGPAGQQQALFAPVAAAVEVVLPPERPFAMLFPGMGPPRKPADMAGGMDRIRRALRRTRPIRFVQQLESADCGAACLAMVLEYHGRETPPREVREVLGTGRSGVTARDLLEAARSFGLRTRGVQLDVTDLHHLPRGAVLHWGFEHFVVFDGLRRDGASIVFDPAVGPKRVTESDLRERFTGVALIFEPAEGFERRRLAKRTLTGYFLRLVSHRRILARALVLSVALQALALALPVLIGVLVDRVVPHQDRSLLLALTLGLTAVVGLQMVVLLLRSYLLNYLKAALDAQLSLGFVEHLADLPLRFFVSRTSGDLLARFESNRNLRQTLTGASLSALLDGSLVFGYLASSFTVNAPIGAAVVGLGLLQVVLFLAMRTPTRSLAAQEIEAVSRAQGHLVEMLAGMETLKAMGSEKRAVERWSHWFVDELNVTLARARLGSIAGALVGGIQMGSPLAILLLGGYEVMEGRITLGTMLTLNALAAGFLTPLSNLVAVALQLQEARGHIDRIQDVMEAPPEADPSRPLRTIRLAGGIQAQGIRFRYDAKEDWIIRDVTTTLEPGRKVAIVGRSGAGKSTLARLLLGLYRPDAGTIRFDGVDLMDLDLRSVRSQIGVVTQDARVFGMSIRDNLALANPSASLDEIVQAARLAEIDREIGAMPLGYDTPLTDGGASLSGGQRQRIALARALAGRPAILLLDEATSDLDTVTERRVTANLAGLGCTRIVIAHRLSTVADADLILVLSGGTLVEAGTHSRLLAEKGEYAKLVDAQVAAGEVEDPATREAVARIRLDGARAANLGCRRPSSWRPTLKEVVDARTLHR